MPKFAETLLALALPGTYTYRIPEGMTLSIGMRVLVPFGRKKIFTAIVVSLHDREPKGYEVKEILGTLDDKPILRLEPDEMQKMLDAVSSGDGLTDRQQKYLNFPRSRDIAMLLLFLGTGIRVSECVGLDVDDLDFDMNAFLVTRKGGDQSILYFPDQVADALRTYLTERAQIQPLEGHENALFLSLKKRRRRRESIPTTI